MEMQRKNQYKNGLPIFRHFGSGFIHYRYELTGTALADLQLKQRTRPILVFALNTTNHLKQCVVNKKNYQQRILSV